MMTPRITQLDIARVAGVHNTTVSLALRNSRLIPPATRQKIQAIAEELGYRPDPALRALAAYRNQRRPDRRATTLAFITNWETRWGWREHPWMERHYRGAQRRAATSGCQLEHFWLWEEGMSQKRLSDMLLHRGISGVILASQPLGGDFSGLDWTRLSGVKIGSGSSAPALNAVAINHGGVMNLAMQRIAAAGHQRVGLVLSRAWDDAVAQAWSKAFAAEQSLLAAPDRIPLLRIESNRHGEGSRAAELGDQVACATWYRRHRPEVVLGLAPQVGDRLAGAGLAVPQEVALVDLSLEREGDEVAGIRQSCERVGELAVEMLCAQLERNELDRPPVPALTTVAGEWIDGASLPIHGDPVHGRVTAMKTNLVA